MLGYLPALHTNGSPRIPQRRNRKHLAHANKGEKAQKATNTPVIKNQAAVKIEAKHQRRPRTNDGEIVKTVVDSRHTTNQGEGYFNGE